MYSADIGYLTYGLSHVGLLLEGAVEADGIAIGRCTDNLAASNIGVGRVSEEGGDESCCVGNIAGIVGSVEDMVCQQSGNDAWVRSDHGSDLGVVEEALQRIIAR